jgi:hypothetical protein
MVMTSVSNVASASLGVGLPSTAACSVIAETPGVAAQLPQLMKRALIVIVVTNAEKWKLITPGFTAPLMFGSTVILGLGRNRSRRHDPEVVSAISGGPYRGPNL